MKLIYIILGFIFLVLGVIGIVLPILPTTPFFILTAFFFAKGSDKFHNWFINTGIYKKYIDTLVKDKKMEMNSKIKVLSIITLLFIIGFIFMHNIYAKFIMMIVLLGHYYYFIVKIKTINEED